MAYESRLYRYQARGAALGDSEVELQAGAVYRYEGRSLKMPLTFEDIEIAEPGPNEVLVRTMATGAG